MMNNFSPIVVGASKPSTTAATIPAVENTGKSCCAAHDASAKTSTSSAVDVIETLRNLYSRVVISQRGERTRVCCDSFAPTLALQSLAEDAQRASLNGTLEPILVINHMKLCKVHRNGSSAGCKLGGNCRNIHLCKQVVLAAPAAKETVRLPPIAPVVAAVAGPNVDDSEAVIPRSEGRTPTPPPMRPRVPSSANRSCKRNSVMHSTEESSDTLALCGLPTPPTSRPNSGTGKCLSRFVRRWNAPLRSSSSSCGSSTTHSLSLQEGLNLSGLMSGISKCVAATSVVECGHAADAEGLSEDEHSMTKKSDDETLNFLLEDAVMVASSPVPAAPSSPKATNNRSSGSRRSGASLRDGMFAICC